MHYDSLILVPTMEMLAQVLSILPTLLVTLGILILGYVISKFVSGIFLKLFEAIDLDKLTGKVGLPDLLRKGGISDKPSHVLSHLVYWVMMVIVLIIAVKSIGLTMATVLLDKLLAYIPQVISGVFVMMLGMLVASLVSSLVQIVAYNTGMPHPKLLGGLTKIAIVIYVTFIFLREIGYGALFAGTHSTILFGGLVLALSLAFGLGGKDMATKYLDVFNVKKDTK